MPNKLISVMIYSSVETLHTQSRNHPDAIIRDVTGITESQRNFRIDLQNGESIFVPSTTIMHVKFQETLQ